MNRKLIPSIRSIVPFYNHSFRGQLLCGLPSALVHPKSLIVSYQAALVLRRAVEDVETKCQLLYVEYQCTGENKGYVFLVIT
ncbi:hypothetical protein GQ600_18408 [Phytophthora cactorum]|nr:hypothetical protein GQ600_18408 [Phytophthora cactorum]